MAERVEIPKNGFILEIWGWVIVFMLLSRLVVANLKNEGNEGGEDVFLLLAPPILLLTTMVEFYFNDVVV